jgi:hypothetical protein
LTLKKPGSGGAPPSREHRQSEERGCRQAGHKGEGSKHVLY